MANIQRASKVISASARDYEEGYVNFDQSRELAVNGAVAAEYYCNVGLLDQGCPFGAGQTLKVCQRFGDIPRPENRSGAHAQELDHIGCESAQREY
jgi:hypothetical protein